MSNSIQSRPAGLDGVLWERITAERSDLDEGLRLGVMRVHFELGAL